MRKLAISLLAPAFVLMAACGKPDNKIDDALSNDLALAASVQPYQPQQFVSPYEAQYGQQPYYGQYQQAPVGYGYPQQVRVQQPVAQRAPMPVRRTSTGTTTTRRAEPVRNTKRDAVIGAVAGAAIGQAIGRDTKGTLIGAGVGAVVGGIIGHTIDVKQP